jgi:type IV pilus assembly protein PilY1
MSEKSYSTMRSIIHSLLPNSKAGKWALLTGLPLATAWSIYATSAGSAPNIEPIALSAEPLYAQGSAQKPTLTLALSVEFPTTGAQYRAAYNGASEYIGYFDVNSCYEYINDINPDLRRFDRTGPATNRQCAGLGFSGNFMNWASGSSIDVLRLALTGGDRIVDTEQLTVLQRAVLQNDFWNNGTYFPQKSVSNAVAKTVVPLSLLGNHNGNLFISNCSNRIFFANNTSTGSCVTPDFSRSLGAKKSGSGTTGPAGTSAVLSTDMFYTRVKVCETGTIGTPPFASSALLDPRTELCQRYPNGTYKPTGNMQKYSDRIRLAAFGYLMDGDARYGGVLRAPMKSVGPTAFNGDGTPVAGLNPQREWDVDTGIFFTNPQNDPIGISGVANYLNTFGRVGPTPGLYKSFDPVGELYYESVRYLQGLQPTPQAVSSISTAQLNGFPAYTTWTDPFEGGDPTKDYSCLKNNIMFIGDVFTHSDKSIPGNTSTANADFNRTAEVSLANNVPNFSEWTRVVGGFESNTSVPYIDGNGVARTTSNPSAYVNPSLANLHTINTGSGGKARYYMAGIAYWANTHDIRGANWSNAAKRRPGMRAKTYVIDVNENSASTNSESFRRSTQFFLTAKYGGFSDPSGRGNPFTDGSNWEQDTSPGEAKTYFLASDAQKLVDAIDEIFASTAAASTSIAGSASSTSQLSTDDGFIYTSQFNPERWSGDVRKSVIKLDGTNNVVQPDMPAVSAAEKLDALTISGINNRKIFVGKSVYPITGDAATNFKWGAIETALSDALDKPNQLLASDGNGQKRLEFIRGDRADEGLLFRIRASRLGDIINSAVVYMGKPSQSFTDAGYKSFYNANANRSPIVFVGANDGMLHAFDANTLEEKFAYIPSWVGPKLSTLTNTDYNSTGHTSFVDATPSIAEANLGSANTPNWKTVLVSGTGNGGQGIFALDVTDPNNFGTDKVLWEFTDKHDTDMGNIMGPPSIMKLRVSAPNAANPEYKWFAVFGSGVNNYVDDGTFSLTGKPAIFMLELGKGASTQWQLGVNYFKISLPFNSLLSTGTQLPSGKTAATGILNLDATSRANGDIEYIYAGDLHGNLWKLDMTKADLSTSNPSAWDLNAVSAFSNSSGPVPFYITKDSTGKVQPLTGKPTIVYGPVNSLVVAVGTGKYLEPSDNGVNSSTQKQSFYVLLDKLDDTTLDTSGGISYIKGRGRLKQAAVDSIANTISMSPFSWGRPDADGDSERAGWYMDLPYSGAAGGEKQITDALVLGNKIYFNSQLPPSASSNACGGGSSYFYAANLASGLGTISPTSSGLQGAPQVFTISSSLSDSDSTGARTRTTKSTIVSVGSGTKDKLEQNVPEVTTEAAVGRLSWRQINNYQLLKNK